MVRLKFLGPRANPSATPTKIGPIRPSSSRKIALLSLAGEYLFLATLLVGRPLARSRANNCSIWCLIDPKIDVLVVQACVKANKKLRTICPLTPAPHTFCRPLRFVPLVVLLQTPAALAARSRAHSSWTVAFKMFKLDSQHGFNWDVLYVLVHLISEAEKAHCDALYQDKNTELPFHVRGRTQGTKGRLVFGQEHRVSVWGCSRYSKTHLNAIFVHKHFFPVHRPKSIFSHAWQM